MAESVLKLINDPELRRTMGERGKSRVMEFDIGTSVAVVEATYRECLDRFRGSLDAATSQRAI